ASGATEVGTALNRRFRSASSPDRRAEPFDNLLHSQLGALGAGLDSTVGVLPHAVAHVPEVVERRLPGEVAAGDAALGRAVALHDPDRQDAGPAVEVLDLVAQVVEGGGDLRLLVEVADGGNRNAVGHGQ